ncbi:Predicted dehydrogenase [Rhizobiales bacterium GAS113]|nr:Predicted dehydrogenase [Rhizobiales bacterium GAS113]
MSAIKIALIGCGTVCNWHLEELVKLRELFDVKIVCDVDGKKAKEVAQRWGVEHWHEDYRTVLRDPDVECLWVLTPPFNHCEISVAALNAGKHVFCEKPLARTSEQCRQILDASRAKRHVFLLGYPMRFSSDAANLRELVQGGAVGRPVVFRDMWSVCKGSDSLAIHDADQGGGVIYEHTHWLDFAAWTFGHPKKIYASTRKLKAGPTTADDTIIAIIDFASGDQAIWSESWAATGFGWEPLCVGRGGIRPTFDVIGKTGVIQFPNSRGERVLSLYNYEAPAQPIKSWHWENDWGTNADAFPNEHRHLYDCIRNGVEPRCQPADGLLAVQLAEAIIESSRSGMPVSLL